MSFGTQSSYSIGDWLKAHGSGGGGNPSDGEHIAFVRTMELTSTKDNKPQFKLVSILLDLNDRQYTWYYPLWEEMLWKLFEDAIAAGCPPDFNPGPLGPGWLEAFKPGFLNRAFRIKLSPGKGDFQNLKILGPAEGPNDPMMVKRDPTVQPATTPAGFPAGGNAPVQVQPAGNPWGAALPMQTGGGPVNPTPWGGSASTVGASPESVTDAASLFKSG